MLTKEEVSKELFTKFGKMLRDVCKGYGLDPIRG